MKTAQADLTTGPLGKQIFRFSIPLIFSNLLQVLFNMADVAVVGRFAGSTALGAVGSTTIFVSLFTGFLIGLSGGVNVLVAHHFGADDQKNLSDTVHSAALTCAAAGLVLLGIGCGFAGGILRALNTKPELMDGAVLYLRIYCLGMPALAVYNFGNAVFSAVGDTRRPLYYLSIAGVINVVLNLFFVIVCNMDVAGVAVASIISQYFSAILVTAALLRSRESYCLRLSQLRFHKTRTKAILSIGIPSGLQNAIFALANLFIQRGVNTFSATMVAGNSAATNADALVYDVMQAFYTACGSFIGQNYGAGKKDRIRRTFLISTAYAFGAGLLLGLGLLLFGRPFLSLFTTDPQVMDAGMYRLTVMSVSYCVSAFMDGSIAASRGLGKSAVPMIIVILGSCVFRIIWVYTVFAWFGTITSLYLLYVFSWTMNELAVIHGNVSCAVSRTLQACSYLTKEWEWLRCESQSAPAFGPQTAEILLSLMDLGQQSVPVLIECAPEIQIVAGMIHAEHTAGAVEVRDQQLCFLQHLMLVQQTEAAVMDPVIQRCSRLHHQRQHSDVFRVHGVEGLGGLDGVFLQQLRAAQTCDGSDG